MNEPYGSAISAGAAIDQRFFSNPAPWRGDVAAPQGPIGHMGSNVVREAGRLDIQIGKLNESIAVAHKLLATLTDQLTPVLSRDPRKLDEAKAQSNAAIDASQSPIEEKLAKSAALLAGLVQAIGNLTSVVRI